MSKAPEMEFYCPTDDKHDITDHEHSNENWKASLGKCPVCGVQTQIRTKSQPNNTTTRSKA